MNLIDREWLLSVFHDKAFDKANTNTAYDMLRWGIKVIKQAPSARLKGKWIPISERLPEKNVEVLATTKWGSVTIAEMYSMNDWFIYESATNAEPDDIVAWMPLPDPYREVE